MVFLIIAVVIVFDVIISYKFMEIAKMKGGHEKYFWWCFFFGMAGWAMVIALPDRNGSPSAGNPSAESDDALPEL